MSIRDFVDVKVGGVDSTSERITLLVTYDQYSDFCNRCHYSITGADTGLLEIYGDHIVVDGNEVFYVDVPTVVQLQASLMFLSCQFRYAPIKGLPAGRFNFYGQRFALERQQHKEADIITRWFSRIGIVLFKEPIHPLYAIRIGCYILILISLLLILFSIFLETM